MDTRPVQLGIHSYLARSGAATAERLVNGYLEQNPANAKGPITVYGDPGLKLWSTVGSGPGRGMVVMNGDLYVVSGNELYAVDATKTATLIGTVVGSGVCRLIENGIHIAVATSSKLYASNRTAHLELPQANMNGAAFQDGYGIFSQAGTESVWITALDNMTSINALDFTTTDAKPDRITAIASVRRELWAFNERTTEILINTGAAGFPFARAGGGFMEFGCTSPGSVANDGVRVIWLANDPQGNRSVVAAAGYNPQVISTPAIDLMIARTVAPDSAEAFVSSLGGHKFYHLNFSDLALVYDLTTGLWHERESYGLGRWRAQGFSKFGSALLVGDYSDGKIYELDLATYDENSNPLVWKSISPPIHAGGEQRAAMRTVFADLEKGVGLVSGQGSDPEVMLRWSDDQGETWAGPRTAKIGKIGERVNPMARWWNLGAFRTRQLELSISDPVPRAIVGLRVATEVFA